MTVLIFTHPLSRFYHLFRHLHNICVLREAHWDPLDHPVRSLLLSVEHVLRPGCYFYIYIRRTRSTSRLLLFLYP